MKRATLGSGGRVFYSVTLHTYICAFLFATLKRLQAGQKTPLFLCVVFINICVKFRLNIAVALD